MTQFRSIKLLLALLLSASTTQHLCSKYCVTCAKQDYCSVCYKHQVQEKKGVSQCGSSLPVASHCVINAGRSCYLCEPGYTISETESASNYCTKGTIQNCVDGRTTNGKEMCFACKWGYPDRDHLRCLPKSQVKSPISNCVIGSSQYGDLKCRQCTSGYVTDGKSCFKSSLKGCIATNYTKRKCAVCDFKNGYFNRDNNGQCSK